MAAKVMGIANGMQRFEAARLSVELGIFDLLAREPLTASRVAHEIGASERGTEVLLEYLRTMSLLENSCASFWRRKDTPCVYSPSAASRWFFVKDSGPAYLGGLLATVYGSREKTMKLFDSKAALVRGGGQPLEVAKDESFYREFADASWDFSKGPAESLAAFLKDILNEKSPQEVLDVACGSGVYGAHVALLYPDARVTALDTEDVLANTRRLIPSSLQSRFSFLPGSALSAPLPPNTFDVILVSNFVHVFDFETNIKLIDRLATSLKPQGIILINDFLRHDYNTPFSPLFHDPRPLEFDFTMLYSTPRGRTYSLPDLDRLFQANNLERTNLKTNFPFPMTFIAAKKIKDDIQQQHCGSTGDDTTCPTTTTSAGDGDDNKHN